MERLTFGKVAGGLVAALVLLGGSFALTAGRDVPGETITPASLPDVVSHIALGEVPVPVGSTGLRGLLLPLNRHGGEPTLGMTSDGTLFVTAKAPSQSFAAVWRSADGGATWRNVAFPVQRAELDPFLHVDTRTDRIFSVANQGECSSILWSDDGGETWPLPPFGGSPTAGCPWRGHDHQSLATGRPRGATTNDYPNVVYYSYQSTDPARQGTYVTRSLDGGTTWTLPGGVMVFESDCQGGLAGRPVVARDGTVYLPKAGCDGLLVGVSEDSGETWRTSSIEAVGVYGGDGSLISEVTQTKPLSPNPALAIDAVGRVYATWTAADALVWLARSDDKGKTWTAPVRVTPPGVNATVFTAAVAGAEGRVSIAYFGTTNETTAWNSRGGHDAPPNATWNLYVTTTLNGTDADPLFTTIRANPEDDPVQRGCIYQAGGFNAPCRQLLDFISAIEVGGRTIVAFADGCRACASAAESRQAALHLYVLEGGPSLRGDLSLSRWTGR